ncbi:MAG: hypothetical protein ABJH98_17825 [Reichenbachiella sp.]|uniref:hypothetical protein n=1 Tax=Reichenbachiella sp. TaxID=2184521 RepID=UPI003299B3C0
MEKVRLLVITLVVMASSRVVYAQVEVTARTSNGALNTINKVVRFSENLRILKNSLEDLEDVVCRIDRLEELTAEAGVEFGDVCSGESRGVDAVIETQAELYAQTAAAVAISTANVANAAQVLIAGTEEPKEDAAWIKMNQDDIDALRAKVDRMIAEMKYRILMNNRAESEFKANQIDVASVLGGNLGGLTEVEANRVAFMSFTPPDNIVNQLKSEKKTTMTKLKKMKEILLPFLLAVMLLFVMYSIAIKGEGMKIETAFGIVMGIIILGYVNIIWQ